MPSKRATVLQIIPGKFFSKKDKGVYFYFFSYNKKIPGKIFNENILSLYLYIKHKMYMNNGKKIFNGKYLHNIINESLKKVLNESQSNADSIIHRLIPLLQKGITSLEKELQKNQNNIEFSKQLQASIKSLQKSLKTIKPLGEHYPKPKSPYEIKKEKEMHNCQLVQRPRIETPEDFISYYNKDFAGSYGGNYNKDHKYKILKDYDNQYTKYHVIQSPYGYNFLHKQSRTLLLKDDLPNDVKLLAYDFTNPNITSPAWESNGKMFYVDLKDKVVPYEGDVAE